MPSPRILLPWPTHTPPQWAQHPRILQLLARGWQAQSREGHTHCGNLNPAQHAGPRGRQQPTALGREGTSPPPPYKSGTRSTADTVCLAGCGAWAVQGGAGHRWRPPSPQARTHTWPGLPTHLRGSDSWKSRRNRQMLGDGREKTGEPECGGSWSPQFPLHDRAQLHPWGLCTFQSGH